MVCLEWRDQLVWRVCRGPKVPLESRVKRAPRVNLENLVLAVSKVFAVLRARLGTMEEKEVLAIRENRDRMGNLENRDNRDLLAFQDCQEMLENEGQQVNQAEKVLLEQWDLQVTAEKEDETENRDYLANPGRPVMQVRKAHLVMKEIQDSRVCQEVPVNLEKPERLVRRARRGLRDLRGQQGRLVSEDLLETKDQ